jgi:hypothetical protein
LDADVLAADPVRRIRLLPGVAALAAHRWDTESAYGEQVAFEAAVAARLLAEWLRIAGDVVHNPAGTGGTIRFTATDADLDLTRRPW